MKNVIKKNAISLLHAYALCTVFPSCNAVHNRVGNLNADITSNSIQNRVGNLNADVRKNNHLNDVIYDICAFLTAKELLTLRSTDRTWSRVASKVLGNKKIPAKIYIPGIEQFFTIDNMLKRILTLKIKYLIVERYNPKSASDQDPDFKRRPTLEDFLPLPENYKPGKTSLADLQFLNVKLGHQNEHYDNTGMAPWVWVDEIDKNVVSWGKILSYTNKIIRLDLSNNHIGDEDVEKFRIMKLPKITQLNMSENNIGVNGAIALSIMDLQNLVDLDLTNNNLQPAGIIALSTINPLKISGFQVAGYGLKERDVIEAREHARLNSKEFDYEETDEVYNEFRTTSDWRDDAEWAGYEETIEANKPGEAVLELEKELEEIRKRSHPEN